MADGIVDLGSQLSGLGDILIKNREDARQEELRNLFRGGLPRDAQGNIDFSATADRLARAGGGLDTIISLSKLADEQIAGREFSRMFGGGALQPSSAAPTPTPSAPLSAPRPAASVAPAPSASSDPTMTIPQRVVTAANEPAPAPIRWGDGAVGEPGALPPPGQAVPLPQARPPSAPQAAAPQAGPQATPQTAPARAEPPPIPGVQSQNPAAGNIPLLMSAVANPRLAGPQRDAAKLMLQRALADSSLTDIQKQYIWYRAQGGTGTLQDMILEQRRAGVATPETTAMRARGQADLDTLKEVQGTYTTALRLKPIIDRARIAVERAPEGWSGVLAATLGRALPTLGIDVPQGASEAQILQSATTQLASLYRLPGATSNAEMSLYMQAAPGLGDTREANLAKIDMFNKITERAGEIVRVYRQYAGTPELYDRLAELDKKPVWSPQERSVLEAAANRTENFSQKWDRRTSSGVGYRLER